MLVKRRSTEINTPPTRVYSRRRVDNSIIELPSKIIPPTKSVGLVSRELLVTSFLQIRRNIWYSVVPETDETSDISSGIRQTWADIMSLLIHCGLIKKNSTASNDFDIISPKWHDFCREFPPLSKLHFCEYRKYGETCKYFICLGVPLFGSPAKQYKAIRQKKLHSKS